MRTVRVFISSPSDVAPERNSARAVVEHLRARFQGQVNIHACFWETRFYDAPEYVQAQLERPSTFDIVVLILWSSLGSASYLDKTTGILHPSGTRYEIADTFSVPPDKRPTLLVCRCRRPFMLPAEAAPEEIARLKANYDATKLFFDRDVQALGITSVNGFLSAADFAEILQDTLVDRIKHIIGTRPSDAPSDPAARPVEPYKGLRVLTAEDRGMFFGRSRVVHRAVDQLRRQDAAGRPFVLVFGRSGVGKSSFVRAGVVPHIVRGNVIEGISVWRTALFEPSDSTTDLIGGLAASLCADNVFPELREAFKSTEAFAEALRKNPESTIPSLRSALTKIASAGAGPGEARVFLTIDPMEEIFTRGSLPEETAALAKALRILCESRLVWIIATVRIDFFGACVEIPDLHVLADGEGQISLPQMTISELGDAVREPAANAGVKFGTSPEGKELDKELVDAAINMRGEPLPLLAYALQQLFERSNAAVTGVLSWDIYEKLHRLPGLLNASADQARRAADERMTGGQEIAWNEVFGQLVTVEANNQRVRLYARKDAILRTEGARILIDELDKARLIITDEDDQHNPVITIAHEAMLRQWHALAAWIEHRETLLKASRALGVAADVWIAGGRATDDLTLRDARLTAAEQFVSNTQGVHVRKDISDFVEAHVLLRDAEAKRKRTFSRLFIIGVTGALMITVALCISNYLGLRQSNAHRAAAQQHAKNSDEFANFLMSGVLPSIDPRPPANQATITEITRRAMSHFKSAPPPGESRADALTRGKIIVAAARQLADLSQYVQAAELQNLGLETEFQAGLSDPSEKASLYLALGDYLNRSGGDGRDSIDKAKGIVRDRPDVDPVVQLDVAIDDEFGYRFKGQYVQAYHKLLSRIVTLKAMKQEPRVRRVLDRAVDNYTESLRYAGHVPEGLKFYREYITELERNRTVVEPRYQVEYAVFLGLSTKRSDIDDAIHRMKDAIDASPFQPEDVAQYRYKLARVLVDAAGSDDAMLTEADGLVELSLLFLVSKDPNSKKSAKAYEVRAKLRLARHDSLHALNDARETVRIRRERYKNTAQREVLDACVLLVDCLDAAGLSSTDEATRARQEEAAIRAKLTESENNAAKELNEPPSDFERLSKADRTTTK